MPLFNLKDKYLVDRTWFVDKVEDAEDAVDMLWNVRRSGSGQRLLSVHVEGVSVGSRSGHGTLLTIGSLFYVSGQRNIVMFDVQSCPQIWSIVSGLLQTPMIRKVFHSCLNDLFEIQVKQKIRVRNAYDIAVADYVIQWQDDRTIVPVYRSLTDLVEDYGRGRVPVNNPQTATYLDSMYRMQDPVWTERPLDQRLVASAAADVHIALLVYVRMVSQVRRYEGRAMMEQIMHERVNAGRHPDIAKQSRKQREKERVRSRRSRAKSHAREL